MIKSYSLWPKSLYRSRAGSHFYGTEYEYEIWADFGPVGNTEKKCWADYEQLFTLEVLPKIPFKLTRSIHVALQKSCDFD